MDGHEGRQGTISVFLLEDQEILPRGIEDLLAAEPGIDLAGVAGTASAAAALDVLRAHGFGEQAARKWLQRHRPGEAVNAWPRGQRP